MANATPCWLSVPSEAVSPLMASRVPSLNGAPDATSTQPNWSLQSAPPVAPPPPPPLSSLEHAAPTRANTPTSASNLMPRCFMDPPFDASGTGWWLVPHNAALGHSPSYRTPHRFPVTPSYTQP